MANVGVGEKMRRTAGKLDFFFALLVIPLVAIGCGGQGDQPELGTVRGTVTMDGKPLPGAKVIFNPKEGRPSVGTTDREGKYELDYTADIQGAKIGSHTIRIVTAEEEIPGKEGVIDEKSNSYDQEKIPAKYNVKSTLREEVAPGENTLDFALTSE